MKFQPFLILSFNGLLRTLVAVDILFSQALSLIHLQNELGVSRLK